MSLGVGTAFGGALKRVGTKSGLKSVVLVFLSLAIVSAGDVLEQTAVVEVALVGSVLTVVGSLALLAAQLVSFRLLWNVGSARRATGSFGWPLLWLFVTSLVVGVAVGIGTVLLVVPGLYLLASFFFVGVVIALEDAGPLRALERSWQLATNHRWALVVVAVVTVLLPVAGSLVLEPLVGAYVSIGNALNLTFGRLTRFDTEVIVVATATTALVNAVIYTYVFALQVECYDQLSTGQHVGTNESTSDDESASTVASGA